MRNNSNHLLKCLSTGLIVALSACGGGGGGGAPTPLTESQIKSATTSANTAYWLMSTVDSIQYIGFNYIDVLGNNGPATGNNTTSVDIDPAGTPLCSSGSYQATWSVNPNNLQDYDVGDTITLNLTNCVKDDGYTYNGSETYTIVDVSKSSTTQEEVTMKSDLSRLIVTTPQIILSSTPLTTVTFSESNILFKRTLTKSGQNYIRPYTFVSTGAVSANITTIAGNIESDSYALSNATLTDIWDTNSNHTYKMDLTSKSNNFKDIVLTNLTPAVGSSVLKSKHPVYSIRYSNASITATTSSSDTVLTGTNSDYSNINNIRLGSSKYFQ